MARSAIVCAVIAVVLGPTVIAHASATTQFLGTYDGFNPAAAWQADNCTAPETMYGSEPATTGRYPVFVYMHGTLGEWGDNVEGQRVVQMAASQGFLAIALTYSSWLTEYVPEAIDAHAKCMFSSSEPHNAITQICARSDADCSRGLLVAGFSQGGAIAARARNFSALVRGAWLMGVNGPAISQTLAAPAGTRALPNDRIRINIGESDAYGYTGATTYDLSALNAMTGRNCSTFSCLAADGSGYYVVGNSEVADGVADHCYWESVNLGSPGSSCSLAPSFDPGFVPPSTLPWSLTTNLNWLRAQLAAPGTFGNPGVGGSQPPPPPPPPSSSPSWSVQCPAIEDPVVHVRRRGVTRRARATRTLTRCPPRARRSATGPANSRSGA